MKISTIVVLCLIVPMTGCSRQVQRFGSVIGVREEALQKYKKMHAEPWPQVNAQLKESNIRNYSIYLTQFPDGDYYLFSYFEYTGDDFEADMKKVADNPRIKEWWSHTDPMQIPLANRKQDERWKNMEEVYHLD
ncbi:MAG: L-rhamnose mutarotase [Planctomycetota bacterium]|jgi:L-rhamnose mutarotase